MFRFVLRGGELPVLVPVMFPFLSLIEFLPPGRSPGPPAASTPAALVYDIFMQLFMVLFDKH